MSEELTQFPLNNRCGEIFCQEFNSFTIICTCCDFKENSFDGFVQHFHTEHLKLYAEDPIKTEFSPVFDFAENQRETLVDINITKSDGEFIADKHEDITPEVDNNNMAREDDAESFDDSRNAKNSSDSEEETDRTKENPTDPLPYKCDVCSKIYKTNLGLKRHFKKAHFIERHSKCNKCTAAFEYDAQLEAHIRKKHSRIPCNICGKNFADKSTLREHIVIHSETKDFPCDVENCTLAFKSRHRMMIHRKRHFEEPKYICEICGYRTKNRGGLVVHRRSHTKEKPFNCKICGKAFISSSMVIEHMPVHSNLRPHKCDTCQATFSTSKALYHHKHLHLGIKKFVCKICGAAYAQAAGLSAHKRTHRSNLPIHTI